MRTADGPLARRYRRLLLAYPLDYRRRRGDELLDTLLEAAPPGRRRPTVRETANLLRNGLRCRLGRPGSRGIVVVAALVAMNVGFLGAAAAARLSWQAARPLPDAARAADIGRIALPDEAAVGGMRRDDAFFYDEPTDAWTPLYGADDYTPGRVELLIESDREFHALLPEVRARLLAAGWRVSEVRFWDEETYGAGAELWARKDGLTIWLTDGSNSMTPRLDLTIVRTPPWWVTPSAVLAGLAATLAGWLLAGWVSRRTEGRHAMLQAATAVFSWLALFGLLPWLAVAALIIVAAPHGPAWWMPVPFWLGLTWIARLPAILGGIAAAAALGIAALPRRADRAAEPVRARR